jgi:hypothetical protein
MAKPQYPKRLMEQFKLYARAGFTVKSVERATRHFKVVFNEFPQPQFLTASSVDQRAYKNNIANYRRLAEEHANVT